MSIAETKMTETLNQINGLLINPLTQRIEQVALGKDDLESIYKLLNCTHVDIVRMPNGDSIYVNDNGLFEDSDNPYSDEGNLVGFFIDGVTTSPIAGFGLVLGYDDLDGSEEDCKSTTVDFSGKLSFGLIPIVGAKAA